MPWSLRWSIALRQTLDPGKGLSAFLSRVSIFGMALAIALRTRGTEDQYTHGLQRLMARVLMSKGEFVEAQNLAQQAVDGSVLVYGEKSGATHLSLDMLRQIQVAKGDVDGAAATQARMNRIYPEEK